MRYEGKSEVDALAAAAAALGKPAEAIVYRVIRDEKSFWGGRVVEIEVEAGQAPAARESGVAVEAAALSLSASEPTAAPRMADGAMDPEAFSVVEATITELLNAAGLLVEVRRRESPEMLFELIGDDVEPLLANRGEGLNGLEVLTGRIAGKRLGRPVFPRLDAEGFRAHQRESLEELAHRSAEEAKRTRRPQLLPPLAPGERRLIHLALAEDPDVETESEGEGFLKRVAVRPKAS
jgi:spoIIIJ-associated protein